MTPRGTLDAYSRAAATWPVSRAETAQSPRWRAVVPSIRLTPGDLLEQYRCLERVISSIRRGYGPSAFSLVHLLEARRRAVYDGAAPRNARRLAPGVRDGVLACSEAPHWP